MTRKKSPRAPVRATATSDHSTSEGLDREIAILRDLIHKAAAKQTDKLNLEEQLELLRHRRQTAPALARLLKARRDLANAGPRPRRPAAPGPARTGGGMAGVEEVRGAIPQVTRMEN